MGYSFRPAERAATKPLIGIYGLSGSGKTMSALLLARGLVGDRGRIAMIDTESGRGQLYADVIPGGYDVAELVEPFSPDAYIEAIAAAEKAGVGALLIDSGSHEWEGLGGVLDMAAEIERKSGKSGLHCWKEPKIRHQRFVLKLLQSSLPVIVCLRAKYKSRQVKNIRTGKNEIVKDDHTTPMQAEDFIYEMTAHMEVMPDHTIRVTKCSHPALRDVFRDGATITVETGRALAAWATGTAPRSDSRTTASTPATNGRTDPPTNGQTLDPETAALLDRAREVADRGSVALRDWWHSDELTREQKAAINRHAKDELARRQREADDRIARESLSGGDDGSDDVGMPAGETESEGALL